MGVTVIDCSTAVVTVNDTAGDEVIPPDAAVIEVLPAATELARPVAPIVAAAVLVEFQLAVLLRLAVLPSE